ncbi:hypothetical protein M2336_001037 [Sphingobium sp. B1D7B]|uniref:hypothetical protein n=1 Tax=Sphingobium sp. B1D7B TaxID=2940578 RepID=UPI0022253236|nr:hypothetical protein [Sphingobium sp. B1D7B]MCW2404408.1 hypothetical protein [Sphingobium sp. B1D7B]
MSIIRRHYKSIALGLFGAALAAMPGNAVASSASGGRITNLTIAHDGNVWFSYTGSLQGTLPACAHPNGLWLITQSQAGYQGLLATLLSVQARGAQVSIQGTGECGGTDHERVAYIVIED